MSIIFDSLGGRFGPNPGIRIAGRTPTSCFLTGRHVRVDPTLLVPKQ